MDDIEVRKLPRHDILNLKLVLEKLAESKPVQQEIEEIKARITSIEGKQAILEQVLNLKFLGMWKRIADIRECIGMPPESDNWDTDL